MENLISGGPKATNHSRGRFPEGEYLEEEHLHFGA